MRSLNRNYSVTDAAVSVRLNVATINSILADKLIAFSTTLPLYTRWRDIWDIEWIEGRGAQISESLILEKLKNYDVKKFDSILSGAIRRLSPLLAGPDMGTALRPNLPPAYAEQTVLDAGWRNGAAERMNARMENLQKMIRAIQLDPDRSPKPLPSKDEDDLLDWQKPPGMT